MPKTTIKHALSYSCWSVVVNLHTFQHITTISCSIYSRHGAKVCKMLVVVGTRFLKKILFKKSWLHMDADGRNAWFLNWGIEKFDRVFHVEIKNGIKILVDEWYWISILHSFKLMAKKIYEFKFGLYYKLCHN